MNVFKVYLLPFRSSFCELSVRISSQYSLCSFFFLSVCEVFVVASSSESCESGVNGP